MGTGTINAGIGESIYYQSEVDDLRRFIVSQEWSLNKFRSIAKHLVAQIVNYDPLAPMQDNDDLPIGGGK